MGRLRVSDAERLDLRDLPPVEPVPVPARFSQTLLAYAEKCRRSAYLYMRHHGGAPGHALDAGTAFHLVAERALNLLIEHGEPQLDPDTGKVLLGEVLAEHPELTVPVNGQVSEDALGVMVYHFCVGLRLNVERVVAVERKFVLELAGRTVSGRIDVALIAGDVAQVRDWKTTFALPSQQEFEDSLQLSLYGLLLLFGRPEAPDGTLEEPLGDRVGWVDLGEVYPRYLSKDGGLVERNVVLSRQELADFRGRVERLVVQLDEAVGGEGREGTWRFPAVSGAHCARCPCEPECPLPSHLRRWAGSVNSMEQAEEAAEWVRRMEARVGATKKELRAFAQAHGPVRAGREVFEFSAQERRVTAWEELESGVERAVRFGEAFDLEDFRRRSVSTVFGARKLSAEELGELKAKSEGEVDLDERYGADAPW